MQPAKPQLEKQNHHKFPGVYISGNGPAVVMLHSSLSSARQWRVLEQALAVNYTCINFDLLGYGAAPEVDNKAAYSLATETSRILDVVEQLIGDQPFHLVGHSFGGAIALKIALENHSRILSLSLYEPVAFHLLKPGTEARAMVDEFAQQVSQLDHYKGAEHFTDVWNSPGFFKSLPQKMQALMAANIDKVNLDFIGLIGERYQAADYGAINAQTLLICGRHSPIKAHRIVEILDASLTNVNKVVIDAGHMGPVTKPELVAELMLSNINQ
ncbi:alpha/beta fold hydrolase [Thalassotalea sp. HSM 43]|uniref:alpha/beta fold hydrolase n=1 Tax=Thalassotalea sp. HSM 43 TaxID=2552945 RepID=UPI0010817B5D|nr:alpha/beta fold hydrolase [Thalassotalea sp. HSM 43]QBY05361.1 alpha/beta fold hydrolase [Thalassotalea sp. HSM 43]